MAMRCVSVMSLVFMVGSVVLSSHAYSEDSATLREAFDEKYDAWVHATKPRNWWSDPFSVPGYVDLVALGPRIVPLVVRRVEDKSELPPGWYADLLYVLTKKDFEKESFPNIEPHSKAMDEARLAAYLRWWHEGHPLSEAHFDEYCQQLKEAQGKEDRECAKAYSRKLRDLGVEAMPLLVEKIANGEYYLIGELSMLSMGYYVDDSSGAEELEKHVLPKDATPKEVAAWWTENKDWFTLPAE